jgi:hypothetical protein
MKELAAAIALLCVSSTVLAHDIYSDLRDRDGNLCCNGQDCKPIEATVLPDGNYYLPTSNEIIPAEMATPSPDDRFHRMHLILGLDQYRMRHQSLDASLLQWTLRSLAQIEPALDLPANSVRRTISRAACVR